MFDMKNQGMVFCCVLLAGQAAVASVLPDISNEVTPIEQADVAIGGAVGRKMTALFQSRFMSDEARTVIYDEAENAFKTHFDDQYAPTFGWWQGEYWGKTMLSAAEVYLLTKDESLRRFLLEKTHAFLAAYQRADGYLGTYKDPKFLKSRHEKLHSQWCWNIWGRKYTIWALYEIYRQTGDRVCLEAAVKSLDQMLDMMAEMRTRFVDTGSFYGLPSCSILKPLLLLYRETGKSSYLEAARGIVADLDRTGNPIPNLVGNAFSDKPVHEWYPEPYFWAKAYETMSCMEGLIEYYRTTGTARVFEAVKYLHVKLVSNEMNPLMGVGYFDHFVDAAHRANAVTEPCDVIHWMRVNRELYILTGDAVYLDFMEKAFYNAFLAGVFRDGRWGAHAVRSHGSRHRPAPSQVGMKRHQCCVDNMPRGFADWTKTQLGRRRDGTVDVNFYSDVRVTDRDGVGVSITGNYPVSNVVTVRVAAATSVGVNFRVPGWCKEMTVDGAVVRGPWHRIGAARGTHVLTFDMTPRVVSTYAENTVYKVDWFYDKPANDWLVNMFECVEENPEMKGRARHSAGAYVMRGPFVLAKCSRAGETPENIFDVRTVNRCACQATVRSVANDSVWGAWKLTLTQGEDNREFNVSDFASAADTDDPANAFSIWF